MSISTVYKKRTDEFGNVLYDSNGLEIMDLISVKIIEDTSDLKPSKEPQFIDPTNDLYILNAPPLKDGE
jgi:hypothetical protein